VKRNKKRKKKPFSMSTQIVNIILDLLIIIFAALAVLISIVIIWIMLFHQTPSSTGRTAHLLCLNMYVSLGIGCAIMLDIYCYTLYGHLHPNISFDNRWCYIKSYLFYVSGCSFFYSYLLQAIYRLCRIVFYTKPLLQSFNLYIGGIILQWILSFLQVIPIYLLGIFEYLHNDYHCQIALSNIRGLFLGLSMVHLIPISLTTICYIYTVVYICQSSNSIRTTRQRVSDRRDLFVLSRVFIILTVMIGSGLPQIGISIFYQYYGYLPYWSTQFQWLTATFSVLCVAVILMFVSPNITNFFRQSFSS
jgi:hypothetical protein